MIDNEDVFCSLENIFKKREKKHFKIFLVVGDCTGFSIVYSECKEGDRKTVLLITDLAVDLFYWKTFMFFFCYEKYTLEKKT